MQALGEARVPALCMGGNREPIVGDLPIRVGVRVRLWFALGLVVGEPLRHESTNHVSIIVNAGFFRVGEF